MDKKELIEMLDEYLMFLFARKTLAVGFEERIYDKFYSEVYLPLIKLLESDKITIIS